MEKERVPLDAAEIVKLKQLPIIEQQLQGIKEQFEDAAQEAVSLECNSETYKLVKARRAELTKIFNALEARRKAIKSAILAPYEAFEKIYKDCITSVYKPCDELLAGKIAAVEDELKAQKISDARAYFDEYAKSRGIDFLGFERAGITIGLSRSAKSIRADIKAFLDKIAGELDYINTLERNSEILVEYRKNLDLVQSINTVEQRHKEIAEIEQRAGGVEIPGAAEIVEELSGLSDESGAENAVSSDGDLYETEFRVWGSLDDLKALKAFLEERKMKYEQL